MEKEEIWKVEVATPFVSAEVSVQSCRCGVLRIWGHVSKTRGPVRGQCARGAIRGCALGG